MARSSNGTAGNGIALSATAPLSGSNGPFTILLWFKSGDLSQIEKYCFQSTLAASGTTQWAIINEYVNNTIEFYSAGFSGTDPRTGSGITVADTNWHHIGYRKDATGSSNWDKFLDGVKTSISTGRNFTLPGSQARLFAFRADSGANFIGSLAEIAIWSVALTDEEINGIAKGISPIRVRRANLLLFWSLRGLFVTGGTTEADLSGNGLNGTITNLGVTDHPPIQSLFFDNYTQLDDPASEPATIERTFEDTLELTDEAVLAFQLGYTFASSFSLSDAQQVDFLIYHEPINLTFSDQLEIGEAALFVNPGPDYETQELFIAESLYFQDHVERAAPLDYDLADTLEFDDLVELLAAGGLEAFDTLQYNWSDSIVATLTQALSLSDTIALSDEAAIDLIVVALIVQQADSLSLSDAIILQILISKLFSDNFTISDEIITSMSIAMLQGDAISFADFLEYYLYSQLNEYSDSMELTDSAIVNLATVLTVSVDDTLALSDSVSTETKSSNLGYLRRYLNDVVR